MRSLNYVSGSGVGALSRGTRAALKRRAIYGGATNGCCDRSVFDGYFFVTAEDGLIIDGRVRAFGDSLPSEGKVVGYTGVDGELRIKVSGDFKTIKVDGGIDSATNKVNTLIFEINIEGIRRNEEVFLNPASTFVSKLKQEGMTNVQIGKTLNLGVSKIGNFSKLNPAVNNDIKKRSLQLGFLQRFDIDVNELVSFAVEKANKNAILSITSDSAVLEILEISEPGNNIQNQSRFNLIAKAFRVVENGSPLSYNQIQRNIEGTLNQILIDLQPESNVSVVDDGNGGGNKYVFNDEQSYNSDTRYLLSSKIYTLKNVPIEHPIAILNNGKTNKITYGIMSVLIGDEGGVVESEVIKILVSVVNQNVSFKYENEEDLNINTFRFMRGKSYKFIKDIWQATYSFYIHTDSLSGTIKEETITSTDDSFYIKIPNDQKTQPGALYYSLRNGQEEVGKGNLLLLNKELTSPAVSDEEAGTYDFCYGDVIIDVT